MTAAAIPFGWRPRRRPLAAIAAVARGASAVALGRRLLDEGEAVARFAAVGAPGWLLIAGSDLPWVEGIEYLGTDPEAPSLYLPTLLEPTWPLDLLTAALLRRGLALPCAVLPAAPGEGPLLLAVAAARPLDLDLLRAWLAEQPG